ncbi:MAG: hypothetical protein ACRDTE_12855 [Pseudonocardiaceae bacterium]
MCALQLAEEAAAKLRAEALEQFLDEWEREHGPLTTAELERAERDSAWRRQIRVSALVLDETRPHYPLRRFRELEMRVG